MSYANSRAWQISVAVAAGSAYGCHSMTVAPDVRPLAYDDLPGAIAALRGRGLRLSTSRRLVLEALFAADGPVSAEYIARGLNLELSSVYRNLETLEQHGLVRHVHLGHGPGLYALLAGGDREYLFCERCAAVVAVAPEELAPVREQIGERFGYEARFQHFAIVGICRACSDKGNEVSPGATRAGVPAARRGHEHAHSHGDHVHSHAHSHQDAPDGPHQHVHEL
jgi:Fur family transcriptional regulator, ferric uptake regulator